MERWREPGGKAPRGRPLLGTAPPPRTALTTSSRLVKLPPGVIMQPALKLNFKPGLNGAVGFIDIGRSVVVATRFKAPPEGARQERRCLERAEQLMPMLERAFSRQAGPPPGAADAATEGIHLLSEDMLVGAADAATEGIHLLSEDMLVHMFSHLEPADLGRSSAACAFWRLAAMRVVLSSPWLSHALGLQVADGEMGVTTDADCFEPFFVGQPSGVGLRCSHAVKAEQTLLEYAGIRLEYIGERSTVDGEYALRLEPDQVSRAIDILKDNPGEYRLHPAAAKSLRAWLASPDSRALRLLCIDKLQQVLPRWIDARIFGNVSRFIKDETEAPNCAVGWTAASILAGQPRAYIVALQDINAGVELSMDYGQHYDRHWLQP